MKHAFRTKAPHEQAVVALMRVLILACGVLLAAVIFLVILSTTSLGTRLASANMDLAVWADWTKAALIVCAVAAVAASTPLTLGALWSGCAIGTRSHDHQLRLRPKALSAKVLASLFPLFGMVLVCLPERSSLALVALSCIGFVGSGYCFLLAMASSLEARSASAKHRRVTPWVATTVFLMVAPLALVGLVFLDARAVRSDLLLVGFLCWAYLAELEIRQHRIERAPRTGRETSADS